MQDSLSSLRERGLSAAAAGEHQQALDHFLSAREFAPDDAKIELYIAGELRALRRFEEAEATARHVIQLNPAVVHAYRILGLIARDRGDYETAIAHFEAGRKVAPGDVSLTFDIAQAYRLLGQYEEALAGYHAVLAVKPGFLEAYRNMGALESSRKNHGKAIEYYQAAIGIAPGDARIHTSLAGELRILGRLAEAEAAAQHALSLKPDIFQAYRILGLLARERGDHEASLGFFTEAQRLAPQEIALAFEAAQCNRLMGRLDEAVQQYHAILAKRPDFVEAHRSLALSENLRGNILAARQHNEKALACFKEMEKAAPGRHAVRIAEMLLNLGRTAEANAQLGSAQSQISAATSADILRVRAAIARQAMNHDEELLCLKATVELRPDQKPARLALARRQLATGRASDAMATIDAAALNFPGDPDVAMDKARVLRVLGRHDESRRELEALCKLDTLPVASRTRLADELRQRSMLHQARDVAASAVRIAPDDIKLRLSRALIDLEIDGPEAALTDLKQMIASGPLNLDVIFQTCRLLRLADKPEAAIQLLDEHALDWRAPSNLFQEFIQALILAGDLERARDALERRRQFNADDPTDLCMQIELEKAAGNIKKLETLFAAIAARPLTHAGIAASVIGVAKASRNFEVVKSAYENWIAFDPSRELQGMIGVAEAEFNFGRRDIAFQVLDGLAEKFGRVAEIYAMRAQLFRISGDLKSALQILEEATREFPEHGGLSAEYVRLAIFALGPDAAEGLLNSVRNASYLWREREQMLRLELHFYRYDFKAALAATNNFTPSSAAIKGQYYEIGGKSALSSLDLDKVKQFLLAAVRHNQRSTLKSPNISQSLIGQLLDEYRLDDVMVTSLRTIEKCPPHLQLEQLLELARDNPGSTPVAIATAIHLRIQNRYVDGRGERGSPIPRRIAQFWDTKDVPPDIRSYMGNWSSFHPDWEHTVFDERSALEFISTRCTPEVRRAFLAAKDPTTKSDLFRLAWLNETGGVYVDADDNCVGPLDAFLRQGLKFIGYQEEFGSVGNNFLASVPGHPIISWALQEATDAILRGDSDMPWLSTGPGLLTRSFARWLAFSANIDASLGEALLLRRNTLTEVSVSHCHALYKNTGQHWAKGFFKLSRDPSAPLQRDHA